MRLTVIILTILAAGLIQLHADTKTTRRGLKPAAGNTVTAVDASQLTPAADSVTVSDYDKPLRSGQETMFVTNRSNSTVTMLSVTIIYLTVNGEMLHRRSVNLSCTIPPGETRQIAFRCGTGNKPTTTTPPASSRARPRQSPTAPKSALTAQSSGK